MSDKPIQEQFGAQVIEAFASFARADLKSIPDLEADEFAHVRDPSLRTTLAQVLYGVRWIYKLGLALLTRDEERAAHVRAQIVDYASICEGLLMHCIVHAIRGGHTVGSGYLWKHPINASGQRINWGADPERTLSHAKPSFWWYIHVGRQFGIVSQDVADALQWLRNQRNEVHLRRRAAVGATAFLNQSKRAFEIMMLTTRATKRWMARHP